MTEEQPTTDEKSNHRKHTKLKCPNCDEYEMVWDDIKELWQCLACGRMDEE